MSDDLAPRSVGKTDVAPEHWDSVFAPSSCLTIITTVDGDGRVNAASFGTCTRVCHAPVYIAFTCGTRKDTYRNVLATGEFTVNVVPFEQDMLNRVMICGLPFRYGINELEKAGLTALAARQLRPPRIAECRTHFECKVAWTQQWENRLMVCGKVAAVSIDQDCVTPQGAIVWDKVKPAHFCGMPYRDHFVPAYDKPTRGIWQYEGPDEEFREGEDWRREFNSKDGSAASGGA